MDAQPIVHDGVRLSANLRRADSVAKARRRGPGEINDVLWAGLRRGDDLRISNLIERGLATQFARYFDRLRIRVQVAIRAQIARVNRRRIAPAGARKTYLTAAGGLS